MLTKHYTDMLCIYYLTLNECKNRKKKNAVIRFNKSSKKNKNI